VKRFLSQDPAHILVGDQRFESKFGVALQSHLGEPQNLNSYSYAVNNPIKFKDKDGKYVETAIDVAALGLSLHELQNAQESGEGVGWATVDVALDTIAIALPFVPAGGGAARRGVAGFFKKVFGGGGGKCLNCATESISAVKYANYAINPGGFIGMRNVAKKISGGHAYSKHVLQKGEFGSITQSEFNNIVYNTVRKPDLYRDLPNGRKAFWSFTGSSKKKGTLVIYDPKNPDLGTAFRPDDGVEYFYDL